MAHDVRMFPRYTFRHCDNFSHYYAFGNSPAEDLLQSVSVDDCREPNILSLGCGDMRSIMFTIFQNFGFEGKYVNGFTGAKFYLNDRSVAVLARNIMFLYLCTTMPKYGARKEWIASVWSLWYNHELLPQHEFMLGNALSKLIEWSYSWETWSQCPLGEVVLFSSPATYAKVKVMWETWHYCINSKSVSEMKSERADFQFHFLSTRFRNLREGLTQLAKQCWKINPANATPEVAATTAHYLNEGTVWAECVLDIPVAGKATVVNPTVYERDDGQYTLHYSSTPYVGYNQSFLYKYAAVKGDVVLKQLLVHDKHFKTKPMLANCVQQFAMWIQATASIIGNPVFRKKISFQFDFTDAVQLCFLSFYYPELHSKTKMQFDAIYTSNLFDHLSPAALVLSALPLLKPNGTLFTVALNKVPTQTNGDYLKKKFGFSPEQFPVLLRTHCIGQDGKYSPIFNHEPYANTIPQAPYSLFKWRNLTSQMIVAEDIDEIKSIKSELVNLLTDILYSGESVEIFICILHHFLRQVQCSSYLNFLQSFSNELTTNFMLIPYLEHLQTQLMLHHVHIHVTVTGKSCPICTNQPLDNYLQQYTLTLESQNCGIAKYSAPVFRIRLDSIEITSFLVNAGDSKLEFTFFLPKHCYSKKKKLAVYMFDTQRKCIFEGEMDILRPSCIDCLFMPSPSHGAVSKRTNPLGEIVKHIGDGDTFETRISLNDVSFKQMEESKLNIAAELDQIKLYIGGLCSRLIYPYAINNSKTHIEISKKKRFILVKVERAESQIYHERPTFYIDPSNKLALPRFVSDIETIDKYCDMQILNNKGHVTFEAKCSFKEIFQHSFKGEKYLSLAKSSLEPRAIIQVKKLCFSPVFGSPALVISYFVMDEASPQLMADFYTKNPDISQCRVSIVVSDEEYQLLKELFGYFSAITQHRMLPVQKRVWKHYHHAVLFPLYPNYANPTYKIMQDVMESAMRGTLNLSAISEQLPHLKGIKEQESWHECLSKRLKESRAAVVKEEPKKQDVTTCERCRKPTALKCPCKMVSYCSKECQALHWPQHKERHPKKESKTDENKGAGEKLQTPDINKQCSNCGKVKDSLKRCSGCKKVQYCNIDCQKQHWQEHAKTCRK